MTQAPFSRRLVLALTPVLALLVSLWWVVVVHGGSPHLPLIGAAMVASLLAMFEGHTWEHVRNSMVKAVSGTLAAIYILMLIGILIGVWIRAGIVPAMIYYGLKIVSPSFFLPTVALTSSIVSLATGSSWSTAGTVGIAFMGMGEVLGIPAGMTAGAIISGAYFGDKMSPLSDTTNLAPAVAGTDLFTHIRHMVWTTGPSLLIALILYAVLGVSASTGPAGGSESLVGPLLSLFNVQWYHLLVPVVILALVAFRVPAIPSLALGIVLGGLVGWFSQDAGLWDMVVAAKSGFHPHTGSQALDELLSRGGLDGMMDTVALIVSAVSFGGAMEGAGFLDTITEGILRLATGRGMLVLSTILTAIGLNIVAGDQYMAIVVPGRMYRKAYRRMGLAPENLSRALEDSGTLTSPLVPWNTCGAFMSHTLGVGVGAYLPYAFLNLINPAISVFYGFTGLTLTELRDEDGAQAADG